VPRYWPRERYVSLRRGGFVPEHALRARELFHLYRAPHGDVAALRGLTFTVETGGTVAILGPSGSGKSTLLTLCAGFGSPSSGELEVLGVRFAGASARERTRVRRRSIGLVRQHYHLSLPRELTVEEIVAFPLRLLGRRAPGRVDRLLREAGLARRAGARPDELSGGEQQRVALCAALAKRPALLLADEPTGELDARSTAELVELLVGLAERDGTTVVVVTHDPDVAAATGRVVHVRDGRLAAEGGSRPVLLVDEQGWLRLPRRLREDSGLGDRVRARATWGRVELVVEEPEWRSRPPAPRLDPVEKRSTEVAVDRVTKRYGATGTEVLDRLSFTFVPERLHVLAGSSGSGKTTLLNLLAGLDYPDEGEVWVGGERVDALSPAQAALFRQRLLGYVSQHSTLVAFLTALENVELALALRGFAEDEARRRASRWLEFVELNDLAGRRADRLSGGEQRRVALARAFAPGPRVLLADEPTAHLDRITGRRVIALLGDAAHEAGITVIAASHDRDLAAAADTVLRLEERANLRPPEPGSGEAHA
jgi:ABC-type lipoprotein export system ATPase subunit